jgi:Flp pilus assembly protein TadD
MSSSTEAAERYLQLGGRKLAAADFKAAINAYRRCVELQPAEPGVHNNLGAALLCDRQLEAAIAVFETASALDPNYQRSLVNLGKALREVGRPFEAIARLERALRLAPDDVPALVNLGDALAATGELAAAQATLERASRLAPQSPEVRRSLAIARLQAGRIAEAIAVLRGALRQTPGHAGLHCCLHEALFAAGEWQQAWPHFEYRFQPHEGRTPLVTPAGMAPWDGSVRPGRQIWLLGEQGLGDQIQFLRYAKVLEQSGARCTVCCDRRLVPLFALAGLRAPIVPRGAQADATNASWVPLMSLPGHCGTRPDSVPYACGYLSADGVRVARWRARLGSDPRPCIGLVWRGNPQHPNDHWRSLPLGELLPYLKPNCRYVSLQKDIGEGDRRLLTGNAIEDFSTELADFADTAALCECLDLVISVDTSVAHLCGALGLTTWLLLPWHSDWRWMRDGEATPWYTSLRLFRQRRPGDWTDLFGQIAAKLRAYLDVRGDLGASLPG